MRSKAACARCCKSQAPSGLEGATSKVEEGTWRKKWARQNKGGSPDHDGHRHATILSMSLRISSTGVAVSKELWGT